MKFRTITAVLLTFVLTMSITGTASASEAESDFAFDSEEISADHLSADGESLSVDAAEVSAELDSVVAELDSMTPNEDYVDGEGVFIADTEEEAEEVASQYGGTLKSYSHRVAVVDFPGSTADALHDAAVDCTATKVVDPNYIGTFDDYIPLSVKAETSATQPNDPYALSNSTYYQYFHEKINTLAAHGTTMGKGVKIAVIDLGTNPEHEDLGAAKDDEHTQYVESLVSKNGVDTVGHGVFCNGVIKSTKNNGEGGYGVAPEAEVYSIKIADSTTFDMNRAIEGLSIAIEDKANVISMSLGTDTHMESLRQLINEAYEQGITVVAAAGNGTNGYGHDSKHYPAAYDHVIAVAASDKEDKLARYSNYGDWVQVVAPGSSITSTYLKGSTNTIGSPANNNNAYGVMSGTSMATPMVAGVAALCYAAKPEFLTGGNYQIPDLVTRVILDSTDEKEYSYGDHSVKGMVQADKAVEMAKYYRMNTSYSAMDAAGIHGSYLTENIARGKTVKLDIGDINGNLIKTGAKEATWSSSDPGTLTVDRGKVKCSKTATIGKKVTVTASLGSDIMTYIFTVTEPVIGAGYCWGSYNSSGRYKLKIKSSIPVNVSTGEFIDLQDPYQLYNASTPYINLVYSKSISRLEDGTWGHACDKNYNYKVTISKSKLKYMTVSKEGNGRISGIKINSPGTYSVKFTTVDGSKKSFTYKIKAS